MQKKEIIGLIQASSNRIGSCLMIRGKSMSKDSLIATLTFIEKAEGVLDTEKKLKNQKSKQKHKNK